MQSLLKEASERFGVLEENYEREKGDNKEEIRRRNDAIRGLKKELDDANELIKTFKEKGYERGTFPKHFLCLFFSS